MRAQYRALFAAFIVVWIYCSDYHIMPIVYSIFVNSLGEVCGYGIFSITSYVRTEEYKRGSSEEVSLVWCRTYVWRTNDSPITAVRTACKY